MPFNGHFGIEGPSDVKVEGGLLFNHMLIL